MLLRLGSYHVHPQSKCDAESEPEGSRARSLRIPLVPVRADEVSIIEQVLRKEVQREVLVPLQTHEVTEHFRYV